jgi:hypothetical protein
VCDNGGTVYSLPSTKFYKNHDGGFRHKMVVAFSVHIFKMCDVVIYGRITYALLINESGVSIEDGMEDYRLIL